jgi:hypothetical protein
MSRIPLATAEQQPAPPASQPKVFEQVHTALGSEATVEVLMIIARYAGLALMLNALDVDLDESARLPIPPVCS